MLASTNQVFSRPHAELSANNAKNVKECTQLYMGHRGITKLANFEHFVNLEVLWINNNEISSLDGLASNFRLKALYAHENRITSVVGSSLSNFKFLTELQLFNNEISDLDATLDVISKLRHIEDLGLFGNPVAEEPDYRVKVIASMPWLRTLDRQSVKDIDRKKAHTYKLTLKRRRKLEEKGFITGQLPKDGAEAPASGRVGSVATSSKVANNDRVRLKTPEELVGERSECTLLLYKQVAAIKHNRMMKAREEERSKRLNLSEMEASRMRGKIPLPSLLDFRSKEAQRKGKASPQLSHWERYELSKLLHDKCESGETKEETGDLSRYDVLQVLLQLEEKIAKRLTDAEEVVDRMFGFLGEELLEWQAVYRYLGKESTFEPGKSKLADLEEGLSDQEYKYGIDEERPPKIAWTRLSSSECISKANTIFFHMEQLHAKFLLLSSRNPKSGKGSSSSENKDAEQESSLEVAESLSLLVREIESKVTTATKLLALGMQHADSYTANSLKLPKRFEQVEYESSDPLEERNAKPYRGDTIRLVSYPDSSSNNIRELDDEEPGFDSDAEDALSVTSNGLLDDEETSTANGRICKRDKLIMAENRDMARFKLVGKRYDLYIQRKRAAQKVAPKWTSYSISS